MSSWRPLVAGTVGLFLVILAFLAGQLKGGGDPGLRQNAAAATSQPTQVPQDSFGAGPQGSGGALPDGTDPDGATPDVAPPSSHQS